VAAGTLAYFSMTERQSPPPPDDSTQQGPTLEDLETRLREARKDSHPAGRQSAELSGAQVGYRVGIEMLAGVVGGAAIGWLLDRLLGTNPWLMVVMLFMGFAAGVLNAYRAGKRAAEKAEDGDTTP
jgi:ATP synthase protein I